MEPSDLTKLFNQKIEYYKNFQGPSERISWDEYFFNLSYLVAERSPDGQTKHGAVIVDPCNRITATGYNGFPSGGPDKFLPNLRPEKYPYMVHAEMNALISSRCDLSGHSVYITGFPCKSCLLHMVAAGIRKVFCGTRSYQENAACAHVKAVLCESYGVSVYVHSTDDKSRIQPFDPKSWLLTT